MNSATLAPQCESARAPQMRVECAWCKAPMSVVDCEPVNAGRVSHGICQRCYKQEMAQLGAPAPLPTAAECPPQLCHAEVVGHPAGGWTIAAPIDATRSTARVYRGNYSAESSAQAALATLNF